MSKSLVTDISYVDPNEGIRLRGYTIPELLEKLPKLARRRDARWWAGCITCC